MTNPDYRPWTPEEEEQMLAHLKAGLNYEETARQIKRTVKATKGRYYKITAAVLAHRVERPAKVYSHPGETPPRQSFMNLYAGELIARAEAKAEKLIAAGTRIDAALNMVAQEYGVRLNPDEFALRPVGEAATRLLDGLSRGVKARA